jgi:hypothetical protein
MRRGVNGTIDGVRIIGRQDLRNGVMLDGVGLVIGRGSAVADAQAA